MGESHPKEVRKMQCGIKECSGDYEERLITHTVRHNGQVVVIDHVPAEICSACGDILLKPETIRRIEELLRTATRPVNTAPIYEYV